MKILPEQKRTWAEIDLDAIKYNFNSIKAHVGDKKICCTVKANGYGHGAVQVAKVYEKIGADSFAVSNIEEALQLRREGITRPILILGYTSPECVRLLEEHNLEQCVFSKEYAEQISEKATQCGVNIKIHIKVDTGMGRIGFVYKTSTDSRDILSACKLPNLKTEGIFTHFAVADEAEKGRDFTLLQYERFKEAISVLEAEGVRFSVKHCANSAVISDYAQMHLDMVRAGIILYGAQPSGVLSNPLELKPALKLKTIVDCIKEIEPGDSVSYGRTFIAQKRMTVATLPIGYADGLWRANSNKNVKVEINGEPSNYLGRICMDQCLVDVTGKNAKVGDVVTVYGEEKYNSVDRVAKENDTINYEILCAVGERVPRVYLEDKKIVFIMDNILPRENR